MCNTAGANRVYGLLMPLDVQVSHVTLCVLWEGGEGGTGMAGRCRGGQRLTDQHHGPLRRSVQLCGWLSDSRCTEDQRHI